MRCIRDFVNYIQENKWQNSGKIDNRTEQTAFHVEILRTSDICAQGPDFSLACRTPFNCFLAVLKGSLE